ncbi:hypothetical protein HPB50_022455 [Hyalomma asiaticum]|uniref:Uncharacterized protein n=1 Tax=Hyalomma asiaticum TaxID=266040 RepID=A0ACB7TKD1_HYAAI|nr:hypothetical protein HPB50_022455 [Hyalomma asiaticum]
MLSLCQFSPCTNLPPIYSISKAHDIGDRDPLDDSDGHPKGVSNRNLFRRVVTSGAAAKKILSACGGEHALGRSEAPLTWGPGPSAVMVLADRVKSWRRRVILAARRHPAGRGGAAIVAAVRWTRSRPETLAGGADVRMRRDRAGVVDRHWRRCVSHG